MYANGRALLCFALIFGPAVSWSDNSNLTYTPSEIRQQAAAEFKAGRFDRAADLYRALTAIEPNNPDLYKDLMWSYWNGRRPRETIEAGERVLKIEPRDVESNTVLAKAYSSIGNKARAAEYYQKVISVNPSNTSAKLALATLSAKTNPAQTEKILRELEKDVPNNPTLRGKLSSAWKGLAHTYVQEDKQKAAIESYARLSGSATRGPQMQLALARVRTDQKNYREARRILEQVLASDPGMKAAYPKLARVQFLMGDFEKSAAAWEMAVHLFPERREYRYQQALAFYFNGEYDRALKLMDELASDPVQGRRAVDFIFNDAVAQHDLAAAAKVMEENLVELTPADQTRLYRLANAYVELRQYADAIATLDRALNQWPEDGNAAASQAVCQLKSGHPGHALRITKELLTRNPSATNLLLCQIYAYEMLGRHRQMLEAARRYRKLDPTNPEPMFLEARALYLCGRKEKARAVLHDWFDHNDGTALPIFLYHGLTNQKRDGLLAYAENMPVEVFADHMRSFKAAGFSPVTSADVLAWARQDDQLPEKPVWITFDDGRMDSLRNADPVLAENRMKATMFVIGQNADRDLPTHANWAELRSYAANGRWGIEAHSDQGHTPVSLNRAGQKGLSLVNHKWVEEGERPEAQGEWIKRVMADHRSAKKKMQQQLDAEPTVYSFPEGNYGQLNVPNFPEAAEMTMKLTSQVYPLCVFQDAGGLNVKSRDPHFLTRFSPPQNWTGEDLLRHVRDENPAVRGNRLLLAWAVDEGRRREADHQWEDLRARGASDKLLARERERIDARFRKRPEWIVDGDFFTDRDLRRHWNIRQSLSVVPFGNLRIKALYHQAKFQQRPFPSVNARGLGGGLEIPLGRYHDLDVAGLGYSFSENVESNGAFLGSLNSRWTDGLNTRFGYSRTPLFGAQPLALNLDQAAYSGVVTWNRGTRMTGELEGVRTHYSDDNNNTRARAELSAAFLPWSYPRIVLRYQINDTDQATPVYYSPEEMKEGNVGLHISSRFWKNYTLEARYLPGWNSERGTGTHFVQNVNVDLGGNWSDSTSLKISYKYEQTASDYYSHLYSLVFLKKFGHGFVAEEPLPLQTYAPEAPQEDFRDAGL